MAASNNMRAATTSRVGDTKVSTIWPRTSIALWMSWIRGDFVALTWEDHRLYLAELSAYHLDSGTELPLPPAFPMANLRVMVPDVDQCWRRANDLGARIITAIDDRYCGLRDFIVADPDGFGVRFASRLQTP